MNENITPRERAVLDALQAIVLETMPFSPARPQSGDSWLPAPFIDAAQAALGLYGCDVVPANSEPSGQVDASVEVYALGRGGVPHAAQEAQVSLGDGAFELERNGVRLLVDPTGAVKSHRLVTPHDRYVRASWQDVRPVDQAQLARFGFSLAHRALHSKTAILSLPQGSGKTLLARDMAARLGCKWVVDCWCEDLPLLQGALHLTHLPVDDLVEVTA